MRFFLATALAFVSAKPGYAEPNQPSGTFITAIEVNSPEAMKHLNTTYGVDFENYLPDFGAIITPIDAHFVDRLNKDGNAEVFLLSQLGKPLRDAENPSPGGYRYEIENPTPGTYTPWQLRDSRYDVGKRFKVAECNLADNDPYSVWTQATPNGKPDKEYKNSKQIETIANDLEKRHKKNVRVVSLATADDVPFFLDNLRRTPFANLAEQFAKAPPENVLNHATKNGNLHFAVLLGKDVDTNLDPAKPNILILALSHARELMTIEVAIDIMEEIANKSYQEPYKSWLEHANLWIIPNFNPDGLDQVWNKSKYWRGNGAGVDLSRNFPLDWGACGGSTADPKSETFRGVAPASELEIRNFMNFMFKYKFLSMLSLHTAGEYVLVPTGCRGKFAKDRDFAVKFASEIAEQITGDCNNNPYRHGELFNELFNVDGELTTYANYMHDTLGILMEINDPRVFFLPSYKQWRDQTVSKMRGAWRYFINKTWQSGLSGKVQLPVGDLRDVRIAVRNRKTLKTENYRLNTYGYFNIILSNGMYDLEFMHHDYESIHRKNISVGDGILKMNVGFQKTK